MWGTTVAEATTIQYGGSVKPDNAAALLPPRPLEKTADLRTAIDRLLRSDVRFTGIRPEERDGVVTLSGKAQLLDHVMELAGQVARLPGVNEVIVEGVRITPR